MLGNNYLLWENPEFIICTPLNPHLAYDDGPILVVKPKQDIVSAWDNPALTGKAFELAALATKILSKIKLAPWFNLQSNGNWGLLPDSTPFFHIYIYGRNKTVNWTKPIVLPEAPRTYNNDPMPEADRNKLIEVFRSELSKTDA